MLAIAHAARTSQCRLTASSEIPRARPDQSRRRPALKQIKASQARSGRLQP
jgi:hypothetical protein